MKYNIMDLINIKWNEGISMRKTKIVCTIGPASSDPKVFTEMCKAGLNVARLNFSHGTHPEQLEKLNMVKKSPRGAQSPDSDNARHKGTGIQNQDL